MHARNNRARNLIKKFASDDVVSVEISFYENFGFVRKMRNEFAHIQKVDPKSFCKWKFMLLRRRLLPARMMFAYALSFWTT